MASPAEYTALLHSKAELSPVKRGRAETRYLAMLEQALGSPSKVRGAYCEYVAVRSLLAENPWGQPSPLEQAALTRWAQASAAAAEAVLQHLQLVDQDAFFELQVWRSATN